MPLQQLFGWGQAGVLRSPYMHAPLLHPPTCRYLVNLDGITASSRLGTLLSINSLVLKQASLWEEW